MNTYKITLSDTDILSMDDTTGNIVINKATLPSEVSVDDEVVIHYVEDKDGVAHTYTVESCDDVCSLAWIKQLEESVLVEAPVIKLDDADTMDPSSVDFKQKIQQGIAKEREEAAEKAKSKREDILKEKYGYIADVISQKLSEGASAEDTLDAVFDGLVPGSGKAETVAGELVRAIMRIIYRDYNDGDKFFEGYGLETCGSSAEYLFDSGFELDIESILERADWYIYNEDAYTNAINALAEKVIAKIHNDPSLLWTENRTDSREYSSDYIEEHQPRYEYQLDGSDDVVQLVEKGVLTAWDLNSYVESQLEYDSAYEGAEVARPWSHHSTEVTVENLTKEGYELLHDRYSRDPDGWWEDLVSEYADELSDDYDDDYDDEESEEDQD